MVEKSFVMAIILYDLHCKPFNFHDLIFCTFLYNISYENVVLDQDKNFNLISLIILITCWLDNLWIFWGEVTC